MPYVHFLPLKKETFAAPKIEDETVAGECVQAGALFDSIEGTIHADKLKVEVYSHPSRASKFAADFNAVKNEQDDVNGGDSEEVPEVPHEALVDRRDTNILFSSADEPDE